MVVYGYKMTGTTDLREVDEVLEKVKAKIQAITDKEYGKLLGEEIAILCDNIALNTLHRNDNKPIADVAREKLDQRIRTASLMGASIKHNLSVYVNIMCYEGDTYIKVVCTNPELMKAFRVSELKDCCLSESECKDQANTKTMLWETLHALYKNMEPLSANLTAVPNYSREKVVFPAVKDRAAMHARHLLINRLLNQLGEGKQIPPYLLMPYLDQALETLTNDDTLKYELGEKTIHLKQVLLDLNKEEELIFGVKEEDNKGENK